MRNSEQALQNCTVVKAVLGNCRQRHTVNYCVMESKTTMKYSLEPEDQRYFEQLWFFKIIKPKVSYKSLHNILCFLWKPVISSSSSEIKLCTLVFVLGNEWRGKSTLVDQTQACCGSGCSIVPAQAGGPEKEVTPEFPRMSGSTTAQGCKAKSHCFSRNEKNKGFSLKDTEFYFYFSIWQFPCQWTRATCWDACSQVPDRYKFVPKFTAVSPKEFALKGVFPL